MLIQPIRNALLAATAITLCLGGSLQVSAAASSFGPEPGKAIKLFIMSGQSNMGGQGESKKLSPAMRRGNPRTLMWHEGRWQPLVATDVHKKHDSLTFGPEIAFAHRMAEAWPDETIGIVKQARGGTGILAWSPSWSEAEADRSKDGHKGDLWKVLAETIHAATAAAPCEIVGFGWVQGGKDTQYDTGKDYLRYLVSLVEAMRRETRQPELPFVLGSSRNDGLPDDLAPVRAKLQAAATDERPYDFEVLQAHYYIQTLAPPARMAPLRDLAIHGNGNSHYNTEGQLELGRLMAEAYLDLTGGK